MRFFLLIFGMLCILPGCKKRPDVLITGEVEGLTQSEILVSGFRPDSTENWRRIPVHDDQFSLTFLPDSIWPVVLVLDGVLELPVFSSIGDEIKITGKMSDPSTFVVDGGDRINEEINQWRNEKEPLESFLRKHPDHPASAWLILNEALSQKKLDTSYLKRLLSIVTPRIAESYMLSPVKKELERHFPTAIEIPYFSKAARSIIRVDREKIDSVLTHEALKNRIDTLINHH